MVLWIGWALLAGCSAPGDVYKREAFELDSPFQMPRAAPANQVCEAARQALLGQGYIIGEAEVGSVKARKAFRTNGDTSTVLEMNVVCVERGTASTLFANAVETVYSLKKSSQSASVGVPVLGSISLPLAGSSDSLVKIGDSTVSDKDFYRRFFAVVDHYLEQIATPPQGAEVEPAKAEDATPEAVILPLPVQEVTPATPIATEPAPMDGAGEAAPAETPLDEVGAPIPDSEALPPATPMPESLPIEPSQSEPPVESPPDASPVHGVTAPIPLRGPFVI